MTDGASWAPGEWTDDTAPALALAERIGACGLLASDDPAARYIARASTEGNGIGRARSAAGGRRGARRRGCPPRPLIKRLEAGGLRNAPDGTALRTASGELAAAALDARRHTP